MKSVRINVSLPEDTFQDLSREVGSRKRSRFIAEAVEKVLKEKQAQRLAGEYREAGEEISRVNRDMEGTLSDGLD
jgi:metal-responsive CopG/Arc/MetJ family transcriptional regulator